MFARLFPYFLCGVATLSLATATATAGPKKPKANNGTVGTGDITPGKSVKFKTPKSQSISVDGLLAMLLANNEVSVTPELFVAQWDSSYTGFSFTQPNKGYQPTYAEKGMKGKPAISFDGIGDVMYGRIPSLPGNERTVTMVLSLDKLPKNLAPILLLNNSEGLAVMATGSLSALSPSEPGQQHDVVETPPVKGPCIVSLCFGNGTTQIFVNGKREALGYYNTTSLALGTGAPMQVGSDGFNGAISDIMVYGRALSPSDRRSLETVLSKTYGIPLADESPLPYRRPRLGKVIGGQEGQD